MMTKNRGDKSELTSFCSEKATSKMALAINQGGLAPSGRHSMYSMLTRCTEILKPDSRADDFYWMQLRYMHVANTHHTHEKYQEITVAPVVARALFSWIKANSGNGTLFTHLPSMIYVEPYYPFVGARGRYQHSVPTGRA